MSRLRIAWITGVLMCGVLALAGVRTASPPLGQEQIEFAGPLADVQRLLFQYHVEEVDPQQLQDAAMRGMLHVLGDAHTAYYPPSQTQEFIDSLEGTFVGIGVKISAPGGAAEIRINDVMDDSPALRAGLEAGDVITHVAGRSLGDFNLTGPDLMDAARGVIRGPAGTSVRITVRDPAGRSREVDVQRAAVTEPAVVGLERRADNSIRYFLDDSLKLAYVRIRQFTPDTAQSLQDRVNMLLDQGMKGLVLDLRFNGGGDLQQAVQVADLFLTQGRIVTTRGRRFPEQAYDARAPGTLKDFPLVVLANGGSASASEVLAGALADHARLLRDTSRRVAIVGTRTYGKGSVQRVLPDLPHGGTLKVTAAYWYLPSGRLVQRRPGATEWGVDPDVLSVVDDSTLRQITTTLDARLYRFRSDGTPSTQPAGIDADPQLLDALKTLVTMVK